MCLSYPMQILFIRFFCLWEGIWQRSPWPVHRTEGLLLQPKQSCPGILIIIREDLIYVDFFFQIFLDFEQLEWLGTDCEWFIIPSPHWYTHKMESHPAWESRRFFMEYLKNGISRSQVMPDKGTQVLRSNSFTWTPFIAKINTAILF